MHLATYLHPRLPTDSAEEPTLLRPVRARAACGHPHRRVASENEKGTIHIDVRSLRLCGLVRLCLHGCLLPAPRHAEPDSVAVRRRICVACPSTALGRGMVVGQ